MLQQPGCFIASRTNLALSLCLQQPNCTFFKNSRLTPKSANPSLTWGERGRSVFGTRRTFGKWMKNRPEIQGRTGICINEAAERSVGDESHTDSRQSRGKRESILLIQSTALNANDKAIPNGDICCKTILSGSKQFDGSAANATKLRLLLCTYEPDGIHHFA